MARENSIAWMGKAIGIVRTPVYTLFVKVLGSYIYPFLYYLHENTTPEEKILPTENKLALISAIAWHPDGDKPMADTIITQYYWHVYATHGQDNLITLIFGVD